MRVCGRVNHASQRPFGMDSWSGRRIINTFNLRTTRTSRDVRRKLDGVQADIPHCSVHGFVFWRARYLDLQLDIVDKDVTDQGITCAGRMERWPEITGRSTYGYRIAREAFCKIKLLQS